jgi:hypothetical protein
MKEAAWLPGAAAELAGGWSSWGGAARSRASLARSALGTTLRAASWLVGGGRRAVRLLDASAAVPWLFRCSLLSWLFPSERIKH